jgi:hypothetical protein
LAIILTKFTNNKGDMLCDREKLTFPTVRSTAFIKVIKMSRCCKLSQRVIRLIRKPLREVI